MKALEGKNWDINQQLVDANTMLQRLEKDMDRDDDAESGEVAKLHRELEQARRERDDAHRQLSVEQRKREEAQRTGTQAQQTLGDRYLEIRDEEAKLRELKREIKEAEGKLMTVRPTPPAVTVTQSTQTKTATTSIFQHQTDPVPNAPIPEGIVEEEEEEEGTVNKPVTFLSGMVAGMFMVVLLPLLSVENWLHWTPIL